MMPVKALPDAMIERFTQIDYDRELALIAVTDADAAVDSASGSASGSAPDSAPRIEAVARIIPTWEDAVAEFAIVVGDRLQHRGLGRALMLRMFEACRARGYRVIEGSVLGDNASMLRFCERLGFTIRSNPADASERIARRELD
jgi:acetyltransferase